MRLSIREKILLPTIVLLIIGIAVVSTIAYNLSADALRESYFSSMEANVKSLSTQVEDWVSERKSDVILTGSRYDFKRIYSENFSDESVNFANRELKNLSDAYGVYETMAFVDTKGICRASNRVDQVGTLNVSDRDYFGKSMNGQTVISDTLISKVSGNVIFVISIPVKIGNSIQGVFLGTVDISEFSSKYIDTIKVAENGYGYVINESGKVIAYPDKKQILKLDLSTFDFGKEMLSRKTGLKEYLWNGEMKVVTFSEVPSTKWIIAIGAEHKDIYKAIYMIRNYSIGIAFIIILVAGLVIFYIVNMVSKAIKEASAHAEVLSTGDFTVNISDKFLKRTDEIGILAAAFKNMTDKIRDIVQGILW